MLCAAEPGRSSVQRRSLSENWSLMEYTWASDGKLGSHISPVSDHPDLRSMIASLDCLIPRRISVNTTWTLNECVKECCHFA
jgi:hypothetical protein